MAYRADLEELYRWLVAKGHKLTGEDLRQAMLSLMEILLDHNLPAKSEMRKAQRKSWVIGEMMLEHPGMSRAEAERLFNELGF